MAAAADGVRKTIRSIQEVVGGHPDDVVYAALQENHMDPDVAAHRLLSQDSFHEVRRRRDKKKELQNTANDIRLQKERRIQWARPGRVFDRNANRGGYPRNSLPGVVQEFRVVKDNRTKQKEDVETQPESLHSRDSGNEQAISDIKDNSSTETLTAQNHSATRNSVGHAATQAGNGHYTAAPVHVKGVKSSSDRRPERSEGTRTTVTGTRAVVQKGGQNNSKVLPVTSGPTNVAGELCCSSSDPIHVPSPGSRSAGIVGAIRREVGVVGAPKQSSDRATANTSTSNSSFTVSSATKDNASYEQQSGFTGVTSKNSRFNPPASSGNRSFSFNQHHARSHLHSVGHQKVTSHLEWKPKSTQNPSSVNHVVNGAPSTAPSSVDRNQVEVAGLSEKLSQASVFGDEHVIIPEHLRVPESERTHLIFGSFESEVDSSKAFVSALETVTPKEEFNDLPSTSTTASNSVSSSEKVPDQTDLVDSQARTSQPDSAVSASEHEQLLTGNKDILTPDVINEYGRDDLISNNVSYGSPQLQHQDNSTLQNFEAYESDSRYDMPFITTAVGDGETAQNIAFPSQVMGSHPANISQLSVSAAAQQPVPQMYHQQVQVPQYPNFLPYRHVFSPVYVPPMAVPNYSSNPAYAQPPHASSYLVMPNGTSQLTANGIKYAPSQYKQVFPGSPAGYGSYPNQNGYPISSGAIGSTGTLEDVNRIKYKDNSLYMPNPQADTADVWIQTPRDIPNMPSSPFYNLTGQAAAPHTAYLPTHTGHAPFNAAPQSSHLQYPGLPHTPQPASMAMLQSPHSMVHQPVPPTLAGNVGVGVAAMSPGAQVGAFQQNQLSHLGWTPNF